MIYCLLCGAEIGNAYSEISWFNNCKWCCKLYECKGVYTESDSNNLIIIDGSIEMTWGKNTSVLSIYHNYNLILKKEMLKDRIIETLELYRLLY